MAQQGLSRCLGPPFRFRLPGLRGSRWFGLRLESVWWVFLGVQLAFLEPWPRRFDVWHESGYRFGWRVMLMEKAGWATYYIQNSEGKEEFQLETS